MADRRRIAGLAGAAAVQALLIAALLFGLRVEVAVPVAAVMEAFAVPPPRPPVVPLRARSHRASGRAAPPHARARATPTVAPPVVVPPDAPPPLVAAPVAGIGVQAVQGAAVAGSGAGAGGQGNGTGSGGSGGGDGGGAEVPLRRIAGRLRDSDYPRGALAAGVSGVVYLRYTVGVDGRVHDCTVTRSSGSAELDATTCRLITQRFRYRPTRDASGRKVPDTVVGEHHWETGPLRE